MNNYEEIIKKLEEKEYDIVPNGTDAYILRFWKGRDIKIYYYPKVFWSKEHFELNVFIPTSRRAIARFEINVKSEYFKRTEEIYEYIKNRDNKNNLNYF